MPAYKNQHYLPLVYLSQFARPPDRPPRQRALWRVTETFAREVPVGGQCQEDYFYSKTNAAFCEGYFSEVEGIYGLLMAELGRGGTLTNHELFQFFLCAVDFFARGAKFRARSEREEFELYLHRIQIFKKRLLSRELAEAPEASQRDFILAHWRFGIVTFPADAALLTSDSPSIWLGSSRSAEELHGVVMPISPLACFIAANQRSYRISSSTATPEDAAVMNVNQMENCVDAIFCSEPLSPDEVAGIQKRLGKRAVLAPRADAWAFELVDYDLAQNLSFLHAT